MIKTETESVQTNKPRTRGGNAFKNHGIYGETQDKSTRNELQVEIVPESDGRIYRSNQPNLNAETINLIHMLI